MKYVKKPIPIEAEQYDGETVPELLGERGVITYVNKLCVKTLDGTIIGCCEKGDYVIKGVEGEYYPIKKDIFLKTYTPVPEEMKTVCLANLLKDENLDYLNNDFIRNPSVREVLSHFTVGGSFHGVTLYYDYMSYELLVTVIGKLMLGFDIDKFKNLSEKEKDTLFDIFNASPSTRKIIGDTFIYLQHCPDHVLKQLLTKNVNDEHILPEINIDNIYEDYENFNFLDNDFINSPEVQEKLPYFKYDDRVSDVTPEITYKGFTEDTITEVIGFIELRGADGVTLEFNEGDNETLWEIYNYSHSERELLMNIFDYLDTCRVDVLKQLIEKQTYGDYAMGSLIKK